MKVRILLTGDFCPEGQIEELSEKGMAGSIFRSLRTVLEGNDINITNLECPLTDASDPVPKNGPHLRASYKCIEAVKAGGFNLLALANNHIMDYGEKGLLDTIRLCEENGVDYLGAGKNEKEASRIYYKTINNKRFAFLNFCEEEFSGAHENNPGANILNPVKNFYSIREARQNSDHVIVIIHGGHEGYNLPSPRMVRTFRFFIDTGADVVAGSHPHCFSGYEKYNNGLIFYSMGNFIFEGDGSSENSWHYGYAVRLTFENKKISFELVPYTQCRNEAFIIPLEEEARKEFHSQIQILNDIINNEESLRHEWKRFAESRRKFYLINFECFSSKFYRFLRSRNIIPGFLSSGKKLTLLNTHLCDSHRDLAIESLRDS